MKLTQRVNYILLPVILLVFGVAGLLIYSAVYESSRQQLEELLQRELIFMQREVNLEQRSVRAALSQVLNSAEMINFLQQDASVFRANALESRVHTLLAEARRNSPGIEVIQVLKLDGTPLVSSDEGNPFAIRSAPALPAGMFDDFLETLASSAIPAPFEITFQSADGLIHFGVLQALSPRLLVNDSLQRLGPDTVVALVTARLSAFEHIDARIRQVLNRQADVQFVPGSELKSMDRRAGPASSPRGLAFELVNPLYAYRLDVPAEVLDERLVGTRLNLAAMVITLTAFSFFALRLLIHRQIVTPINTLVESVREAHHENNQLSVIDRSDEVSELNNAYVNLLQDVHHLASFDHLTNLANRRTFLLTLDRQLRRAADQSNHVALLFIDLDNFKRVNDQYGHDTGDKLLKQFSAGLGSSIRPADMAGSFADYTSARIAGDEFAVMLTDIADAEGARTVADRIQDLLEGGFEVEGIVHNIQASIGIALAPEDGTDAHTLLGNADAAMYEAKAAGKNRSQFFNRNIAADIRKRHRIEEVLDRAIQGEELHLVYMPVFDATTLRTVGAEVLLRCQELAEEGIGPDEFIPVAESNGQIQQIDLWVFDRAVADLRALREQYQFGGYFAINISAVELHNEQFPDQVRQLLEKHGMDPALIELEITETSLVNNDEDSIRILHELKALGLRLALDDFGTGYTAFNQLADYPVDSLKIDRSFVADISLARQQKRPMVEIILALAELYDLRVIAEGVETREQLDYLQGGRCDQLQGYHLSRPLSWSDMQALASSGAASPLANAHDV